MMKQYSNILGFLWIFYGTGMVNISSSNVISHIKICASQNPTDYKTIYEWIIKNKKLINKNIYFSFYFSHKLFIFI